jgi:hypothetical protein
MDTKLKYPEIIKSILTKVAEYCASIPDRYNSQVLFDDEHGRYLVLDIGWNDDQYLQGIFVAISWYVISLKYNQKNAT